MPARRSTRCRSGAALLAVAALTLTSSMLAFAGGAAPNSRLRTVSPRAEGEEAPTGSSSMALVKVNEENSVATAGVLAGVAGLLVGGVWVGGALFVASSFLARKKDDDLAKGLNGIAAGGLEALNFVDYLNNKYEVTAKVGSSLTEALDGSKNSSGTVGRVSGALDTVGDAIKSFDEDVGIKNTLGGLILSGSEYAFELVDKAIALNDDYKLTDQLTEKINGALNQGKS